MDGGRAPPPAMRTFLFSLQTTNSLPRRRTIRHASHIFLMLDLTFIANLCACAQPIICGVEECHDDAAEKGASGGKRARWKQDWTNGAGRLGDRSQFRSCAARIQVIETMQRFVVVGGGVAGVCCAEELCRTCPDVSITLVSASKVLKASVGGRAPPPQLGSDGHVLFFNGCMPPSDAGHPHRGTHHEEHRGIQE